MKISIITTTFNAADTLRDCLESVQEQKHVDVEHIVVDAASTDGTLEVLSGSVGIPGTRNMNMGIPGTRNEYMSPEYPYSRNYEFRMVSEADSGIYDGMNKGLRLVTGDIVGILNGDDFYFNHDVLGKVARVFEDEGVDACYGDLVYVKESIQSSLGVSTAFRLPGSCQSESQGTAPRGFKVYGSRTSPPHPNPLPPGEMGLDCESDQGEEGLKVVRYWKSGEFGYRKFYWGWMPPHPTFFVRRSVYEKYGLFNLELGTAADYELMLRFLVKHEISCAYLPEILVKMRSGGASNVTMQSRLRANRMDRKAWAVNGLKPYPWTLMMKPLRKVGQWFSKPPVLKFKVQSSK